MSSDMAKNLHSVNFGTKNTWDDWNLIPIKRPSFVPPDHKYVSVDIPGADGELDLSDVLTDYPVFENRKGSLTFRMYDNETRALSKYSEIMNTLHGQRMQCILDEEPDYYYIGRFTVGGFSYKGKGEWADIVIDYNVEPYKYLIQDSTEEWLWDPFNFETGVIRNYSQLAVNGTATFTIVGSRMPVSPKFIVDITSGDSMTLTYGGNTYTLTEGTNVIASLILEDGENTLSFSGYGTVTIEFKGGSL